ncbi:MULTISPECIES: DUF3515 family protein [unclassified Streptomyces]|uniref:DUF3515 family protein n=1 Tax=unclassified Streptomyces TaxID=2593676 RepID=UPI00225A473E|nr:MULTISPECIES: DUF3515 family protein [unclassified Streptomyces]MCX5050168.1 DUF3515 family protein [Streptomyces sp. NBC_00474]
MITRGVSSVVRGSRRTRAAVALGLAGLVAGTLLVVCEVNSPAEGVRAAPRGDAPECHRVAQGFPPGLAGLDRTDTDVPGVAVWGDGAVTARCGLRTPDPTLDPCVSVDGIDWVWRPKSPDGARVLVTYGRDPAVEITLSARVAAVDDVLVELSRAVRPLAQHDKCIGDGDLM